MSPFGAEQLYPFERQPKKIFFSQHFIDYLPVDIIAIAYTLLFVTVYPFQSLSSIGFRFYIIFCYNRGNGI